MNAPERRSILLIEDDPGLRTVFRDFLVFHQYRVLCADLIKAGWTLFTEQRPDLVVLDLHLPDGNGLDFCQKVREHKKLGFTPVIILTGKAEYSTKVAGFKAGADQYLIKPVSPQEILLWIEALLRRVSYDQREGQVLRAGDCEIDVDSHLVKFKGEIVPYLTTKEFDLLYFIVSRRPQVLSRKDILSHLWHTITVDHVVDTHLTNLRRKLPRELSEKIQNIPGKGFRFLD